MIINVLKYIIYYVEDIEGFNLVDLWGYVLIIKIF